MVAPRRSSEFIHKLKQGDSLKDTKDPLEEYFMEKFKEMGISVVPPQKKRKKQD